MATGFPPPCAVNGCPDARQYFVGQWSVSDLRENLAISNQVGVEFLLTDLDVAMTFLDLAAVSHNEETTRRNYCNARTAYDTVLHLLEKLTPDAEQRKVIDAKLALLKTRLRAVDH